MTNVHGCILSLAYRKLISRMQYQVRAVSHAATKIA